MIKLLVILVIVLAIVAIVQLSKVYELSRSMRNTREEEISPADNKMNAWLWMVWMIVFFVGTIVLFVKYGDYLPPSASEHGVSVDKLMAINMWGITVAFFIVNFLLFYFSWKYYYRKGRKSIFQVHDSRLEMLWTLIPGVSMAFIIIYGLITWNKMTGPAGEDALRIELYSKQFDWTARYSGDDGVFGAANYNLITNENALGIITDEGVALKLAEIEANIHKIEKQLEENSKTPIFPETKVEALHDEIYRLQRHKQRILDISQYQENGVNGWTAGADDRIVKGEFHMPVNKEIEFIFTSRDVIHSAYMPHFRAQMNTVPGVPTRFKMKPTITTAEMRKIEGDDKFDYILLCNKICGSAHFNMQMKVVVETEEEYNKWLAAQKTFIAAAPAEPVVAPADTTITVADTTASALHASINK